MVHFMYFLVNTAKNQSRFGQDIKVHLKGFIQLFQKTLWLTDFRATIRKMLIFKNIGFRYSFGDSTFFLDISNHNISRTVKFEAYEPYQFLQELNKIFQVYLNYFKDHNCESKHDKQTNYPIFFIYSLGSLRWYISFLYLKVLKFHGVPSLY